MYQAPSICVDLRRRCGLLLQVGSPCEAGCDGGEASALYAVGNGGETRLGETFLYVAAILNDGTPFGYVFSFFSFGDGIM